MGGANAHGVAFLKASQHVGVKPRIISCTSGMIHWVAEYLRGKSLGDEMKAYIAALRVYPSQFNHLNLLRLMTRGLPTVFEPNHMKLAARLLESIGKPDTRLEDILFPADTLRPIKPASYFEDMAKVFNESETGILLNTFNPIFGIEYVHYNEAARDSVGYWERNGAPFTQYRPITPEMLRAALWLLNYGLEETFDGETLIDGVYHRQIILRELMGCDTVFIGRPLSVDWGDHIPRNAVEMETFKTKMLFSSSYYGELNFIFSHNQNVAAGRVTGELAHEVELQEVAIEKNIDFLGFFLENEDVYDTSFFKSKAIIRNWLAERAAAQAAEKVTA
ncbi:hypothetical protein N825_05650 [Skermanella stibiiresistens SB22]|uniref:PNPLA domain-containing protein n=2 Tax=Skermanella TaxID=204447 RepID=W9H0J2_9PROT|nr:hypothetical protein N825_05650 [Skermanella stibiiresistens SB22]